MNAAPPADWSLDQKENPSVAPPADAWAQEQRHPSPAPAAGPEIPHSSTPPGAATAGESSAAPAGPSCGDWLPPDVQARWRRQLRRKHGRRVQDLASLLPRKVPTERDFLIYYRVNFLRHSQVQVAADYGLSQPRVCQIARRIQAWMATRNWDIGGMNRRQQINLTTHETRLWLEVIRDKALAGFEASSQYHTTRRYKLDPANEYYGSRDRLHEHTISTQRPTAGFLAIALTAILKAGLLGGAGQQWPGRGRARPMQRMARSTRRQRAESAKTPLPTSKKRLLKQNSASFSPVNGKCNGHKIYTKVHKAQVGKNRLARHFENAYSLPPSRLRPAPRGAGKKGAVAKRG